MVSGTPGQYNNVSHNGIVRINPDGTLDNSFSRQVNLGYVITMQLQNDGKVIVGGVNFNFGINIKRLNSDGSADDDFNSNVGTGFNNNVWSMLLLPNGKILVGGQFSSYNGELANTIARLNSDGTQDLSFLNPAGPGNDGYPDTMKLQPDGKILLGGGFAFYDGSYVNGIVRLNSDGTRDTTFNTGTGFASSGPIAIAIQPDGKILAVGDFTSFNGTPQTRITRLNADGSRDTTFNTGTGFNATVRAILVEPDGKIIVSGDFTNYNGSPREFGKIIRLNADGSVDQEGFTISESFGGFWDGDARALTRESTTGNIFVGGSFTRYGYNTSNNMRGLVKLRGGRGGAAKLNGESSTAFGMTAGGGEGGLTGTGGIASGAGAILFNGGSGGYNPNYSNSGGGGAAGYTEDGQNGSDGVGEPSYAGGAGGNAGNHPVAGGTGGSNPGTFGGSNGGGIGLYGIGEGAVQGGAGGNAGEIGRFGGVYGGGTAATGAGPSSQPELAGRGAVRIIWGGGRSFPNSAGPTPPKWEVYNMSVICPLWMNREIYDIHWNGSQYLMVGENGGVATSPDGITWTYRSNLITGTWGNAPVRAIAWDGSKYVIGGGVDNGTDGPLVATSTDGITWTVSNSFGFTGSPWNIGPVRAIIHDGTQFIITGGDPAEGYIATSPDGITWTGQPNPLGNSFGISLAWNENPTSPRYFVAGADSYSVHSTDTIMWNSENSLAVVWSSVSFPACVVYNPTTETFIVGGYDGGIATSTATATPNFVNRPALGILWNANATAVRKLIHNNGTLVAVGDSVNSVAISIDGGITWENKTSLSTLGYSGFINTIATNGKRFILGGADGQIAVSSNTVYL